MQSISKSQDEPTNKNNDGYIVMNRKAFNNPDFKKLSAQTKWIYTVLCSYSNSHDKSIWPSYQTIAIEAGTSRCVVKRAIKILESAGFISLQSRGVKRSNLISFKTPKEISKIEPYLVSNETLDETKTRVHTEPIKKGNLGSNENPSRVYTEPLLGSIRNPRTNKEQTKEHKDITASDSKESKPVLPEKKIKPKTDPYANIKDHTQWDKIYNTNPSGVIALWVDHWKVYIGTSVNQLAGKDAKQGKNIYLKANKDVTRAGLIIRQAFNEYHKQTPNGVWPFNKGQAPTLDKICSAYLKLDAMIPKPEPEKIEREKTDAEIFWEQNNE
jgi:hypothetical protein